MALVWQRTYRGRHYEVRSAGQSLRLYTNGAFHSQFNARHLFSGAVWDLLTLPALMVPVTPDRVLMLGVGGGASMLQLNRVLAPREIVGIEQDPVHVAIARRFFKVDVANTTLITADAIGWTRRSRRRFDMVVDDLFLDTAADPARPTAVDAAWLTRLAARVSDNGVLVQNHLSLQAAKAVVHGNRRLVESLFETVFVLTTPAYENGVLALSRQPIDKAQALQRALARIDAVHPSAGKRLRYRMEIILD